MSDPNESTHLQFAGEFFASSDRALQFQRDLAALALEYGASVRITEASQDPLIRDSEELRQAPLPEAASPELNNLLDGTMTKVIDSYVKSGADPDISGNLNVRALTMLKRAKITTIRELLAVGQIKFQELRGVQVGPGILGLIEPSLKYASSEIDPNLEWQQEPSANVIVALYPDIFSVPGLALDAELLGMTLGKIIETTVDELANDFGKTYHRRSNPDLFIDDSIDVLEKFIPDKARAELVKRIAKAHAIRLLDAKKQMLARRQADS